MSFDLDRIKADNPIADIVCRQVTMQKNGSELVGLCPFHGERTPSFTVTPAKGLFKCFGCDAQGDVIDFVRKLHDVDLPEACEILGGKREPPDRPVRMFDPPEIADIYAGLIPQPVDALPRVNEPLRCWNPKRSKWSVYKPLLVHPYRTDNGAIIGVVIRIEIEGKKLTPQLRYVALPDGELTWSLMPFEKPRPLYRLDELAASTDTVLLLEGEKCADAAAALLGRTVTCWPGGTHGVSHADWRPLAGRAVVIWGDADQEGENAIHGHTDERGKPHLGVVHHLHEVGAKSVHVVPWDRRKTKGWDVADAIAEGWTAEQVTTYVRTAVAVPRPADEPNRDDPGWQPDERTSRRSRRDAKGEIQWPDPIDILADGDTPGIELREDHIPAALWPFVTDTAARMGADPTSIALSCLVSCASVINDEWRIQPKRFDYSWSEQARLWAAIIGDPSTIKTPLIAAATKPVDLLDIEACKVHAEQMRQWRSDMAIAKLDKEPFTTPQPKLNRYMTEGSTVEALSEVLRGKDDDEAKQFAPAGKVLCRHDEMSEFFANLDRYKSGGTGGGDRGAYLRLYNGGRYTVDRIGRGSFAVPNWSACFLGGCQPGPIQRIARESVDDGLLQRFIFAVPGRVRDGQDRAPDHAASKRYGSLFPALAAMRPAPEVGNEHIRPISIHTDGHAYREEMDSLSRAMAAMPDTSRRLKAAFGKWPGLFARLCLTFHLIEVADARCRDEQPPPLAVVPVETIERVSEFMQDIVLPNMLRAEALMFATDQTNHARSIAGIILAQGLDRLTLRDIMRNHYPFRSPEAEKELRSVMASLVAIGWAEPEEPTNPVKPVHAWVINPAIKGQFAARAETARQERQTAKEQLAADMERMRHRRKNRRSKP